MLDSEARKVHYTVDFDENQITGELKPEKITALRDHKIHVKILATNKGKIYVIYSDPLKTKLGIDRKQLFEPTGNGGDDAELEVLTLSMAYRKNF